MNYQVHRLKLGLLGRSLPAVVEGHRCVGPWYTSGLFEAYIHNPKTELSLFPSPLAGHKTTYDVGGVSWGRPWSYSSG